MDHIARPQKHRLGAIGALLNIVRQPRTIGDPERDQPLMGMERQRENEREREVERDEMRDVKAEGNQHPRPFASNQ